MKKLFFLSTILSLGLLADGDSPELNVLDAMRAMVPQKSASLGTRELADTLREQSTDGTVVQEGKEDTVVSGAVQSVQESFSSAITSLAARGAEEAEAAEASVAPASLVTLDESTESFQSVQSLVEEKPAEPAPARSGWGSWFAKAGGVVFNGAKTLSGCVRKAVSSGANLVEQVVTKGPEKLQKRSTLKAVQNVGRDALVVGAFSGLFGLGCTPIVLAYQHLASFVPKCATFDKNFFNLETFNDFAVVAVAGTSCAISMATGIPLPAIYAGLFLTAGAGAIQLGGYSNVPTNSALCLTKTGAVAATAGAGMLAGIATVFVAGNAVIPSIVAGCVAAASSSVATLFV